MMKWEDELKDKFELSKSGIFIELEKELIDYIRKNFIHKSELHRSDEINPYKYEDNIANEAA